MSSAIESLRHFLTTTAGKVAAAASAVVAVGVLFVVARGHLGEPALAAQSRERVFVCAETGQTFSHTIKAGDTFPVMSPHTGRPTGHQAELCYWTKDGQPKDEPTYVLLNQYKSAKGPTFCPDCDRLVVNFNPGPVAGVAPPPTRAEHGQRKARPATPSDREDPDQE